MEEDDKGYPMIRMGVSGECFFWYRPTRVVPDKRPLNGCVCVCVCYALANCVICITAVERLSLLDWQFYEVIGKLMFLW